MRTANIMTATGPHLWLRSCVWLSCSCNIPPHSWGRLHDRSARGTTLTAHRQLCQWHSGPRAQTGADCLSSETHRVPPLYGAKSGNERRRCLLWPRRGRLCGGPCWRLRRRFSRRWRQEFKRSPSRPIESVQELVGSGSSAGVEFLAGWQSTGAGVGREAGGV